MTHELFCGPDFETGIRNWDDIDGESDINDAIIMFRQASNSLMLQALACHRQTRTGAGNLVNDVGCSLIEMMMTELHLPYATPIAYATTAISS